MDDPRNDAPARQPEIPGVSLYTPLRVLLQNRHLVVASAILVALLAAVPPLFDARSYTATAAFMPQGASGGQGGLAAFAGQLGFQVPQTEPTQSPQFYAEIATSRELLGRLLKDTFHVAKDFPGEPPPVTTGTLADLLQVQGEDAAQRRVRALRRVERMLALRTTPTGMVRLEVTSPWPDVSSAVAERLIQLINEFNLQTRQSNAAAERRFVEERLADAADSLRRTEGELRAFLEANRQFENSPQLLFEHDRLQRELSHRQQMYTGLQESYESARISQIRDTPLITVVESPEPPVYPDSRRIPLRGILGLLLGAMVGAGLAFLREFFVKGPATPDPEYDRLRSAWTDTLSGLRLRR